MYRYMYRYIVYHRRLGTTAEASTISNKIHVSGLNV
jgi:hypothetical protein